MNTEKIEKENRELIEYIAKELGKRLPCEGCIERDKKISQLQEKVIELQENKIKSLQEKNKQ